MKVKFKNYILFTGDFGLRFFNWDKAECGLALLFWWEINLFGLHLRKNKSNEDLKIQQERLNKENGKI